MSADKLTKDNLDEFLARSLRRHSQPTSPDFTENLLRQIRKAEEKKILARVILQERLALAACIALGLIAIVGAALFPTIAASFTPQADAFVSKMNRAIEALSHQWQFFAAFAAAFAFAVYSLVDFLVGDSWQ